MPVEWHRWGAEAADAAQDRVGVWLRAQIGEPAANELQAAGSACHSRAMPEAAQSSCTALSRQTAASGTPGHGSGSQRWLQQREPSAAEPRMDDRPAWAPATEEGASRGQLRPAMFSEKGCTTTLAAEHRHWLRLIRQRLQVTAAAGQAYTIVRRPLVTKKSCDRR